ncbi:hypothetical protein [Streptomyces canus]|uniref:hypothetical protein n=1 Tax=Streptomyces canus TaxID=58343 RepID=UPI0036E0FD07
MTDPRPATSERPATGDLPESPVIGDAPTPRRIPGLPLLVATVVATLVLGAIGVLRANGPGDQGGSATTSTTVGTPTPAATPPAVDVRRVHNALHDIDARCGTAVSGKARAELEGDADTVTAFARRYPDASFRVDDETGTTLSLLLVVRQGLRDCAPTATARVNQALPPEYRDQQSAAPS